jgi:hypothetical protein
MTSTKKIAPFRRRGRMAYMTTAFKGEFALEYLEDFYGRRSWFVTQNGVVIAADSLGDDVRKVWNSIRVDPVKS